MSDRDTEQAVAAVGEPCETEHLEIRAESKHPPMHKEGAVTFKEWFEEQVAVSAKEMEGNYAKADSKKLLSDYLWARKGLDQLKSDVPEVGEYMKRPGFMEAAEPRDLVIKFFAKAYSLTVYSLAVLQITTGEIVARARRNKVNVHFGLLKLAILSKDHVAERNSFKKVQALANGIARNNELFRSDGEGWDAATGLAVFEQLNRFADMDWQNSLEFMIDGKFAVVGEAIRQRIVDEVRGHMRRAPLESLDDEKVYEKLEGTVTRECNPEDRLVIESILSDLGLSSDGSPTAVQRVLAAIGQTLAEPDLGGFTGSQLVEEIKERAATIGNVTERQARNDWNAFKASQEALAKIRRALREIVRIKEGSK